MALNCVLIFVTEWLWGTCFLEGGSSSGCCQGSGLEGEAPLGGGASGAGHLEGEAPGPLQDHL